MYWHRGVGYICCGEIVCVNVILDQKTFEVFRVRCKRPSSRGPKTLLQLCYYLITRFDLSKTVACPQVFTRYMPKYSRNTLAVIWMRSCFVTFRNRGSGRKLLHAEFRLAAKRELVNVVKFFHIWTALIRRINTRGFQLVLKGTSDFVTQLLWHRELRKYYSFYYKQSAASYECRLWRHWTVRVGRFLAHAAPEIEYFQSDKGRRDSTTIYSGDCRTGCAAWRTRLVRCSLCGDSV